MIGIVAYGAYIPIHRLKRADIARFWGAPEPPGEKAVANYDEDGLSMAIAAARDCLSGMESDSITGLYFASTTAPYKEKQSAAFIAAVLGLNKSVFTADFCGSLRCGTNALRSAMDAVESGSLENVLVCASDIRLGHPRGSAELFCGDGAASFLIGKSNLVAEIEGFHSEFDEIQDVWRSDKDHFIRSAEGRFAIDEGYGRVFQNTVSTALEKFVKKPEDFNTLCSNAQDPKTVGKIARKLGFEPKTQLSGTVYDRVGDTGSAMVMMNMVEALQETMPGERILAVNYGNGCDVVCLKATEQAGDVQACRGVTGHLEPKLRLDNYNKYLIWRGLVDFQPPARPPKEERQPTPAAQWREVGGELPLKGTKCNHCGTPQYPPQRICLVCKTKDDFESYPFANRKGKIFSFSHDYVMETLDAPVTIVVVDFEDGGRIMCDMTDRDQNEVSVGMAVEMTFRKLYYVGGIYNYWWKCKPVRAAEKD